MSPMTTSVWIPAIRMKVLSKSASLNWLRQKLPGVEMWSKPEAKTCNDGNDSMKSNAESRR
jgi:hypothetical protein